MSFASVDFLIFFAFVLLVCLLLDKAGSERPRELFLLAASYFFYGYWDWRFCLLLLFVSLISYFCAQKVHIKWVYALGIVVPLIVLGIFKYFNFFIDSFAALIGRELGTLAIVLPVGISFYTFQGLSYVIDVKRGKIEAEKSFVKLALYLSFFPQLVAGPIVKAADFMPQLHERRYIEKKNVLFGIQLIAFGMFKKLVLSDNLSVFVDDIYFAPETYHWFSILIGQISYAFQIYLDFSGYSDIAIGCAKCMGYDFKPNFNLPYISKSITEYWRRWHLSLSTWFTQYVYIPLGGSRKGRPRQLLNLMITMLLSGLWHGAAWTYVFWGAINGVFLCIEKVFPPKNYKSFIMELLQNIKCFALICISLFFFRASSFNHAWRVMKCLFSLQDGVRHISIWAVITLLVCTCATACAYIKAKKAGEDFVNGYYPILDLSRLPQLTLFFIELGLIAALFYTGAQPFVYFQF